MTRVDFGTRPARDSYPPARPEVMDAAMVIFGAAVGCRFQGMRVEPRLIEMKLGEWVEEARRELERTTMQRLPEVSVTLEPGGQLVIAWVVD